MNDTSKIPSVTVSIALALSLIASYILNAQVFPAAAEVYPASREFSTYTGVAFSLLIALAAYRKPILLKESICSIASILMLAFSLALLYVGVRLRSPEIVSLGSPFGGIGSAWFCVVIGMALIELGPWRSMVAIPAAFMVKYAVQLTLVVMRPTIALEVSIVVYFVAIGVSYLLVRKQVHRSIDHIRTSASPVVLDITNPHAFLPFSSYVYASIFLFNAACGFAFAGQRAALDSLSALVSFLPVAVIFVVAITDRKRISPDRLYQASTLFVFAGFLITPLAILGNGFASPSGAHTANALLYAGSDCFSVLSYFLIAAVGARNPFGALSTSAFASAASWLGIGCGALAVQAAESLSDHDPSLMMWALAGIVFAFMTFNFLAMRNRSFEETIQGMHAVPLALGRLATEDASEEDSHGEEGKPKHLVASAGAPDAHSEEIPPPSLDDKCVCAATRFELTNRELDVLKLLARGRTGAVIQEKLVLSQNTVKTHVRHIYTKMDVHSQQELIDIVEGLL